MCPLSLVRGPLLEDGGGLDFFWGEIHIFVEKIGEINYGHNAWWKYILS